MHGPLRNLLLRGCRTHWRRSRVGELATSWTPRRASTPSVLAGGTSGSSRASRPRTSSSAPSCSTRRSLDTRNARTSIGFASVARTRSLAVWGGHPHVDDRPVGRRLELGRLEQANATERRGDGVPEGEVVVGSPVEELLDARVLAVDAVVRGPDAAAVAGGDHLHPGHAACQATRRPGVVTNSQATCGGVVVRSRPGRPPGARRR